MQDKYIKMLNSGDLYDPRVLGDEQISLRQKVNDYNNTIAEPSSIPLREEMLRKRLKNAGKNIFIEPPFHSSWGGSHVSIGNDFYANFNLTLIDDAEIIIGNNVRCGPNVTIVTAAHPIHPKLRKNWIEYNKPVVIGDGVWIGACCTILPGVHIGNNSVIGAGSVVIKDIPDNVVAFGSPAKVYREITQEDYEYYDHGKKISQERIDKNGF